MCLRYLLGWIVSVFRSRDDLVLENLALRQQLLALHAKRPRPRLSSFDKLFWVVLRRVWSGWKKSLILVTPETVVRWHRAGFRLYWSWISRRSKGGWKKTNQQGSARADLPHGRREPNLGSAPNPRRVAQARVSISRNERFLAG